MSSLHERLREERERLELSQADFAALGLVQRNSQVKYESGERKPDAEYLWLVAQHGVDCQYVITGVRSLNMRDVERAAMDRFAVQYRPVVKLQKDVDEVTLAGAIADVIRVCEKFPQLEDVDHTDKAKAVIEIYQRRMGKAGDQEAPSMITSLVMRAV